MTSRSGVCNNAEMDLELFVQMRDPERAGGEVTIGHSKSEKVDESGGLVTRWRMVVGIVQLLIRSAHTLSSPLICTHA